MTAQPCTARLLVLHALTAPLRLAVGPNAAGKVQFGRYVLACTPSATLWITSGQSSLTAPVSFGNMPQDRAHLYKRCFDRLDQMQRDAGELGGTGKTQGVLGRLETALLPE